MSDRTIAVKVATKDQRCTNSRRCQHQREANAKHHEWVPGSFQGGRQHGDTTVEPEQLDELECDEKANKSDNICEDQIPIRGELKVNVPLWRAVVLWQAAEKLCHQMITVEVEEDGQHRENDVGELHDVPELFKVTQTCPVEEAGLPDREHKHEQEKHDLT